MRLPFALPACVGLACVGLACALASCAGEPTDPSRAAASPRPSFAVDQTVATVRTQPDSLLMIAGDNATITAQVFNAAGDTLSRSVTWKVATSGLVSILSKTGSLISFKARKAGITTVSATVDGRTGTTKLVIRDAAGAQLILSPDAASVAVAGTVQFSVSGRTKTGETATVSATYSATGGTVSSAGVYSAGTVPGIYRVIAKAPFGAADTAAVTITPATVTTLVLVPDTATVPAGSTRQFSAYGRTSAGDSVPVTSTFEATGGTIAASGVYTAGGATGSYRVIAHTTNGLADTSEVTVTPSPIAQLVVTPGAVTLAPGETQQFTSYGRNTLGDSVDAPTTWTTTGGDITAAGLYTAGTVGGTFEVKGTLTGGSVSASAWATTTTSGSAGGGWATGVPYGLFGMFGRNLVDPYTSVMEPGQPDSILSDLANARARGARIFVNFAGGSVTNVQDSAGHFDYGKWKARVDRFLPIQVQLNDYVADGTLYGFQMIDEPFATGTWGVAVPKSTIDSMAQYSKSLFPGLLTAIRAAPDQMQNYTWLYLDASWAQYTSKKGPIATYVSKEVAAAQTIGLGLVVGLNIAKGGDGSSGNGNSTDGWSMSGAEILQYGQALLGSPYSCAFLMWDNRASVITLPDVAAALQQLAGVAAAHAATPCKQ